MSGKILICGASGQVGSALSRLLGSRAVALDYPEIDFARPDSLVSVLDRIAPSAVINAAAYTAVDLAEQEEAKAKLINEDAPGAMARWCARQSLPFVHYSTDYVFNGEGEKPWSEDDTTGPLSAYGRTKLAGERAVTAAGGKHLTFRTSWVYAPEGKNFVNTMLKLGAERDVLKVVADQHGAPTYAPHLAEATLLALENAGAQDRFPSGIYHLCNQGETTWHGFARAIFESARSRGMEMKVKVVEPIPTEAYPVPARRPRNSRLNTEKARRILGVHLPQWQLGLNACLDQKVRS